MHPSCRNDYGINKAKIRLQNGRDVYRPKERETALRAPRLTLSRFDGEGEPLQTGPWSPGSVLVPQRRVWRRRNSRLSPPPCFLLSGWRNWIRTQALLSAEGPAWKCLCLYKGRMAAVGRASLRSAKGTSWNRPAGGERPEAGLPISVG